MHRSSAFGIAANGQPLQSQQGQQQQGVGVRPVFLGSSPSVFGGSGGVAGGFANLAGSSAAAFPTHGSATAPQQQPGPITGSQPATRIVFGQPTPGSAAAGASWSPGQQSPFGGLSSASAASGNAADVAMTSGGSFQLRAGPSSFRNLSASGLSASAAPFTLSAPGFPAPSSQTIPHSAAPIDAPNQTQGTPSSRAVQFGVQATQQRQQQQQQQRGRGASNLLWGRGRGRSTSPQSVNDARAAMQQCTPSSQHVSAITGQGSLSFSPPVSDPPKILGPRSFMMFL